VRELVLVLPDLFLRGAASASMADASLTALRFAAPRLMRGGWRGTLARGVGREDLSLVDEASVIDAALRVAAVTDDTVVEAWIATPVHLMAGLKTVHFPANGVLRLSASEANAFAEAFASTFGGDGLELHPAGAAGFVLRGLAASGASTVEPARLLGDLLETHLPSGAGSAELRALTSEIEMWLHDLPLNRQRALRGEPPISSVWLWGGGQPPRDPLRTSRGASLWSRMVTEDTWAKALADLAGVPVSPLPDSLEDLLNDTGGDGAGDSVLVVAPLTGMDAPTFDRAYVAPAARALHDGRLERFTIAANDRWASVESRDRYRFWRPHRTAFTAVADGGV